MAISTPHQYPVRLTLEQRQRMEQITRCGQAPARKIRHAQVLLMSDRGRPGGRMKRTEISEALGMHVNTVDRIRKRFVCAGEEPALDHKVRLTPPTPPKLDGRGEAHLVAICCGPPPKGRTRWTLSLLANALVARGIVTHICAETVRKTLKKTNCGLGGSSAGASRSGMRRDSWRRWKTSSICTPPNIRRRSR